MLIFLFPQECSKADAAQSKADDGPPGEQPYGDISVQARDVANEVDNEEGDCSDLEVRNTLCLTLLRLSAACGCPYLKYNYNMSNVQYMASFFDGH